MHFHSNSDVNISYAFGKKELSWMQVYDFFVMNTKAILILCDCSMTMMLLFWTIEAMRFQTVATNKSLWINHLTICLSFEQLNKIHKLTVIPLLFGYTFHYHHLCWWSEIGLSPFRVMMVFIHRWQDSQVGQLFLYAGIPLLMTYDHQCKGWGDSNLYHL